MEMFMVYKDFLTRFYIWSNVVQDSEIKGS